jgi:protocatechuate 3,4-dioxygenase beta subunit
MRTEHLAIVAFVTLAVSVGAERPPLTGSISFAQTPSTSVVSGIVVTDSADAQPVRRATVRLIGSFGSSSRTVGTDDDGRFRFEGLPAGSYLLSVVKTGFVASFHGSSHPGRGPGTPIAVADGQRIDVTLKILAGAAITGVITDGQGNPVAGITVVAGDTRPVAGTVMSPGRATSDDRGVYRVFGLAPGEYLVSAMPRLLPALEGRGGPSTGGAVQVVTSAEVNWARNTAAGTTTSAAPPAGPVVAYAPTFYPGTTNASSAIPVRVATAEERADVSFALRIVPMSRISGTLVDVNGQPITTATVTLHPRRGERPSAADALALTGALPLPRANVSAAGFAFTGVAPGEYTLVARTGSGQRGARPPAGASEPVTLWNVTDLVVEGSDRHDLALRLLPGLALSGTIVFEGATATPAAAVGGIDVTLAGLNPIPGVTTPRAVVSPDGSFRFASIPPGSYVLRASAAAAAAAQWTLESAMLDERDIADRPLAAGASGEERAGLVATLTDRAAEIAGRAIDASGQPATRYPIVVFTTDKSLWLPNARRVRVAQPATDGSFAIDGLPAGEYAIAAAVEVPIADLADPAFLSQLLAASFRITLAAGEKRRQDLKIGR